MECKRQYSDSISQAFSKETIRRSPFIDCVTIRPLRGYEVEALRVGELMRTVGAADIREGPLAILFRERGRVPRRYTLRPKFDLRSDLSARETARRIIRKILLIARENEPGIVNDIDTEFLHDYRICIRKIRSVLSLIKGIYPEQKTAELKAAFAEFFSVTNRLRDLDVYLLTREQYTAMLPASIRPGLKEMFEDFGKERRHALRKVVRFLESAAYRSAMEAAESFFGRALPCCRNRSFAAGWLVLWSRDASTEVTNGSSGSSARWEQIRLTRQCTKHASTVKSCDT